MLQEKFIKESSIAKSDVYLGQKPIEDEKDEASRFESLLEKDNQVSQAVQLLKSWNVISQIKTGS